jgi:hypothetical protein
VGASPPQTRLFIEFDHLFFERSPAKFTVQLACEPVPLAAATVALMPMQNCSAATEGLREEVHDPAKTR